MAGSSFRAVVLRYKTLNDSFGLHDQLDEYKGWTPQTVLFLYLQLCVPFLQYAFLYVSPEYTCLRYPDRPVSAVGIDGKPVGVLRASKDFSTIPGFCIPVS